MHARVLTSTKNLGEPFATCVFLHELNINEHLRCPVHDDPGAQSELDSDRPTGAGLEDGKLFRNSTAPRGGPDPSERSILCDPVMIKRKATAQGSSRTV